MNADGSSAGLGTNDASRFTNDADARRAAFEATLGPVSPPMYQAAVRCDGCGAGPLLEWFSQWRENLTRRLCAACVAGEPGGTCEAGAPGEI